MHLKSVFFVSLFTSILGQNLTASTYNHDLCKDILRDGVKDELASNSSKKHKLVKHYQFCSIAKKHNLSSDNFENFAQAYAKQVKESSSGTGAGGGVNYGIFSLDGDYSKNSSSSSLTENEKIDLLKKNSLQILDYYENNCGDSSYEEQLETEANLTTRVANTHVIEGWRDCMTKRHGVFSYPIFTDEDLFTFSIRIEYYDKGTRHIDNVSLEWIGNNIATRSNKQIDEYRWHKTENLLNTRGVIYSGGSIEIPLQRTDNTKNDMIWVHTSTGDGVLADFSFKLPKIPQSTNLDSIPLSFSNKKSNSCIYHQKKALAMGGIDMDLYKLYVETNIAPIPVFPDDWNELVKIDCRDLK